MSLPTSTNLKLTPSHAILTPESNITHVTNIISFLTDTPRPSPINAVFKDDISDLSNSCAKIYSDRKERAVADLLTRFKNLVSLAASPVEDGATKEVAAAQGFVMEVESTALVRAAEDLLKLTRELKEMWLFGQLRAVGEGEGEGKMDEDSVVVKQLIEGLLEREGRRGSA